MNSSTTTTKPAESAARTTTPPGPVLDLVIPVYNEAHCLERSVRRVRAYLDHFFPYSARVTIADNASTDGTLAIATTLAEELPGVRVARRRIHDVPGEVVERVV